MHLVVALCVFGCPWALQCAATKQICKRYYEENDVEVIDLIDSRYLVILYVWYMDVNCTRTQAFQWSFNLKLSSPVWLVWAVWAALAVWESHICEQCVSSVWAVWDQCGTSVSEGTVAIGSKHDPISSTAPGRYFPQNLENLYKLEISGAHMVTVGTWTKQNIMCTSAPGPNLPKILAKKTLSSHIWELEGDIKKLDWRWFQVNRFKAIIGISAKLLSNTK